MVVGTSAELFLSEADSVTTVFNFLENWKGTFPNETLGQKESEAGMSDTGTATDYAGQGAYEKFSGHISRTVVESRPAWTPRSRPPDGSPNVVIVLCDDLGFADLGCFGSEIETPHVDRLAATGIRFTNYHTTPLCGPTRAALLTGVNPHLVGYGFTAEDYGFPGYRGGLSDAVLSAGEIFRVNGYSTFAVGKWHLTPRSGIHDAGEKGSWALQRGFDRFYGMLDGRTNALNPHLLFEDNHVHEVDAYPDGYMFSDDITDQAISMIRSVKMNDKEKPFFLYLAHSAPHSPLVAKPVDMAKYRGRYDLGWDEIRKERFNRQLKMGIFPPDTVMAPRNNEPDFSVLAWDKLSARQQELFARYMEVYAGMVDNIDQNLGRLIGALRQIDELDNTLFVFLSDNGASREGGEHGTTELERNIWTVFMRQASEDDHFEKDYERRDLIGGPRFNVHYPRGWSMAGNTPFRLYKSTTFAGGMHVPLLISWTDGLSLQGIDCDDFCYVTDILPTLVDLIGLEVPTDRHGRLTRPFNGNSFSAKLFDPTAPTPPRDQYTEIRGERSFYRDGWKISTLHYPGKAISDDEWQLYHLVEDPTEIDDLSAVFPERVAELAEAWEAAAWENQVFPLDHDATAMRNLNHPADNEAVSPVTLYPSNHTFPPMRAKRLMEERSHLITVKLEFRVGDQGILIAHGDQGGGYALYVENDSVIFAVNSFSEMSLLDGGELVDGVSEIVVDVQAPGGGGWNATLLVEGTERGTLTDLPTWTTDRPCEGIDVGIDRRSPVCWDLAEKYGTFPYSGILTSVTYTPGEYAPDATRRIADNLLEDLFKDD